MLLLYTPRITKRKKYSVELVIYNLCGYKYEITDNQEYFLNYEGAKINYSKERLASDELFFSSDDLLDEKGVKSKNPKPVLFDDYDENIYTIFQINNSESALPFDPFAASFYFVSRYEEYLPHTKDIHGRFEADQSLAYKAGFLEKPVVNHYANKVDQLIKEKFPFIKPAKKNSYRFLPTYDIDQAYAYKGKDIFRIAGGYIKSLIDRDFESIRQRTKVLTGREIDPYDTYPFQLELHNRFGIKPYYFFLVGDFGLNDKNPSIYNTVYQNLVKKLGDYAFAGIHPSYASNQKPEKLKEEIWRLTSILNREIKSSRQHYLKLDLPHTYHRLIQQDITKDFTMGFASHIGFRAGTCTPFFFYDIKNETKTSIKIYPFAVMDGTLKDYMNLDINTSIRKVKKLVDEVYNVKGTFITLWHNDSLCECGRWKGWKDLYVKIFKHAAEK